MMLLFFLLTPQQALSASRRGLMLWFTQLLPTLLPFTVLSYVILCSGIFDAAGHAERRQTSLTGRRQTGCALGIRELYVIVCGFLFGFPIGSKLTADMYSQGLLSREKANVLFVFTNNLSPVFVTSVFQEQLGRRPSATVWLLLYGIPLVYGILRLSHCGRGTDSGSTDSDRHKNAASRFELNMQIIDAGILNGFETLIKICGYIIMFSLAAELLAMLPLSPYAGTLLTGIAEVTNGMSSLSTLDCPDSAKYLTAMLFLSLGGVSGMFQAASIVSRTDLSMKTYLKTRLLLTALTVLGTVLAQFLDLLVGIR